LPRECVAKSLRQSDEVLAVSAFATSESCAESAGTYDLILFHAHRTTTDRKQGSGGRTMPFDKLLGIAPVVVLSDVDAPEAVLEAFESGVRGLSRPPTRPSAWCRTSLGGQGWRDFRSPERLGPAAAAPA
jgi:hypothetical protein